MSRPRCLGSPRRGVAILVVLVVISVAFALSYAIMRSQSTALLIQNNAELRASARQAAITGLTVGLKRMHTADWEGVDTTLTGSLDSHAGFQVTYTTGDPSLAPDDEDYWEYPYRVTLISTGRATDPGDAQRAVTCQMRAVARLIPRKLADTPPGWSDIVDHTLCQWRLGYCKLNVPLHIEGPTRVRGTLDLGNTEINWPSAARQQYLGDLNEMRLAGGGDWRPVSGPVSMFYWWQYWDTRWLLNTRMDVATSNKTFQTEFSPPSLSRAGHYRLYPGGKEYSATTLRSRLENTTLEPDPETNPLGIFVRYGNVRIRDNVTIRGTLITIGGSAADVDMEGESIQFAPPQEGPPPVAGSSDPIRLPAILSSDDITVQPGANVSIRGIAIAQDDFRVESADQDETTLGVVGRVAAKDLYVRRRREWNKSHNWWEDRLDEFEAQREEKGGLAYFPEWLAQAHGLDPTPRITMRKETENIHHVWRNPDDPLFVPHPDDATELDPGNPGLLWELIEWTENL